MCDKGIFLNLVKLVIQRNYFVELVRFFFSSGYRFKDFVALKGDSWSNYLECD